MIEHSLQAETLSSETEVEALNARLSEFVELCERQAIIQNMTYTSKSVVDNAKEKGMLH